MTTITEPRITETDLILADMLTENTGRHILDSGGAYGRHWERNQGMTPEDFINQPAASWGYSGEYVLIDVFHFLRGNLEYNAELQADFDKFADENPDDHWMALMEKFAIKLTGQDNPGNGWQIINSYNSENSLSQDIQFVQLSTDDGDWIYGDIAIVQIHGGCDIRGGYTAPKVFSVNGSETGLLEFDCYEVSCAGKPPPQNAALFGPEPMTTYHSWSFRHGECIDVEGCYVTANDAPSFEMNDDGIVECPECGAACEPSWDYWM